MQKRLKGVPDLPFPPIVAGIYGIAAGFLVYSTPQWLFEHAVDLSGIAQFVPAATPPLGEKARMMAAAASVVGGFVVLWPVLALGQSIVRKMRKKPQVHVRARGIVIKESLEPALPPKTLPLDLELPGQSRAPIFADNELGAPLMSDEALVAAEELVLDQPLDMPEPVVAEPSPYGVPLPPAATPFTPATEWQPRVPDPVSAPAFAPPANWQPSYVPQQEPVGSQFRINLPEEVAPVAETAPDFTPMPEIAPPPVSAPPVFAAPEMPVMAQSNFSINPLAIDLSGEVEIDDAPVRETDTVAKTLSVNPLMIDLGLDEAPAPQLSVPSTDSVDAFDPAAMRASMPDMPAYEAAPAPVRHPVEARIEPAMDSMQVKLFNDPAPVVQAPPTQAAAPAHSHAPSAPIDESVGGLMARLNLAMGGKTKAPPAPVESPLKVNFNF